MTLAAYASLAEYRARTGDQSTGADATLTAQLAGASRLLDRSLQSIDGAFLDSTGTYVLDAVGGTKLPLRVNHRRILVRTFPADSIGVDSEADGTYDGYSLDLSDVWVRGIRTDNAAGDAGEPYSYLELLPHMSGAAPSQWPDAPASVKLTGVTTGWATTPPQMIVELTIRRVQELRNGFKGGAIEQMPTFDDGTIPMAQRTAWLWREAERLYGARLPTVA